MAHCESQRADEPPPPGPTAACMGVGNRKSGTEGGGRGAPRRRRVSVFTGGAQGEPPW